MLQITVHQSRTFDDLHAIRLDAHMVKAIGEALPELLRDHAPAQRHDQLTVWIDKGCERAVDMGIEEESDLAAFVALQLAHTLLSAKGQEKLRGWTGDLLQRSGSSGHVRLALVRSTFARLAPTEPLAGWLHGILTRVHAAYP